MMAKAFFGDPLGRLFVADDDGYPRKAKSVAEWVLFMENREQRTIGSDVEIVDGVEVHVSTVNLGVDYHIVDDDSPPLLWETMVFGGEHDGWTDRYDNHASAVAGHAEACLMALGRFPCGVIQTPVGKEKGDEDTGDE